MEEGKAKLLERQAAAAASPANKRIAEALQKADDIQAKLGPAKKQCLTKP